MPFSSPVRLEKLHNRLSIVLDILTNHIIATAHKKLIAQGSYGAAKILHFPKSTLIKHGGLRKLANKNNGNSLEIRMKNLMEMIQTSTLKVLRSMEMKKARTKKEAMRRLK